MFPSFLLLDATRLPPHPRCLKWKLGGDLIAVSSQFFFQDDSNLSLQLDGYWRVDLHTSYDITPRVQIFGLVNNLSTAVTGCSAPSSNLEAPAAPAAVYGGVKAKFW